MIGLADWSAADCCAACWPVPCAAMSGAAGVGVRSVPRLVCRGGEVAASIGAEALLLFRQLLSFSANQRVLDIR